MRFLGCALLLAGCVAPGVSAEQAAIVGGVTDNGDPAVGLIIIGDLNGGAVYLCTGEVISPHVILTAGHCTTGRGPFNFYLGTDLNRVQPNDLISATAYRHPQYNMNVVDNYDIGVLVLNSAVPDSITPLPFNKTVDPNTLRGQAVRLIGYGSTGSLSSSDTSAGLKRQTSTTLSAVQSRLLEFDDTSHNTCEGDSGGPALVTIDGVETIVGVTSFGEQSPDYCDGRGFDTRVDLYADSFVQPFVDMYDPDPSPPAGSPGSTGYSCNADSDCYSQNCTGPNGYCTAGCDPTLGSAACPAGMHCQQIGDPSANYNLCYLNQQQRAGGCDVTATPPPFGLLLLLLPLMLLRRFSN
jgi:secreted trypsin-like serine protease